MFVYACIIFVVKAYKAHELLALCGCALVYALNPLPRSFRIIRPLLAPCYNLFFVLQQLYVSILVISYGYPECFIRSHR